MVKVESKFIFVKLHEWLVWFTMPMAYFPYFLKFNLGYDALRRAKDPMAWLFLCSYPPYNDRKTWSELYSFYAHYVLCCWRWEEAKVAMSCFSAVEYYPLWNQRIFFSHRNVGFWSWSLDNNINSCNLCSDDGQKLERRKGNQGYPSFGNFSYLIECLCYCFLWCFISPKNLKFWWDGI